MHPLHEPFPSDGHDARWQRWDASGDEMLTIAWDNEGWTVSGTVTGPDVQYVIRLSPLWRVRQFLLFRDLDDPDLWLGTDGHGRWGEINGAHRVDLDGAIDVHLDITPFTRSIPIRRLALDIGAEAPTVVLDIDVETLGVVPVATVVRRLDTDRYAFERADASVTVDVDRHGLVVDVPGRFRRVG